MASIVISSIAQTYPAGTTVSAYAALPGSSPPDAVPPGAVVATGVVSSTGALTISGLADGAKYWLYAQVASDDRVVAATAEPASTTGTEIKSFELTLTETTGAGTYTASGDVPAGATLQDIIVTAPALWTATTSAVLIVGDATDPDGFYTAVDLKADDLLAGESLSFAKAGGQEGAYITATHVLSRYSAAVRTISAVVTTVGAAGSAGRTRVTVIYSAPGTADIHAAVKA